MAKIKKVQILRINKGPEKGLWIARHHEGNIWFTDYDLEDHPLEPEPYYSIQERWLDEFDNQDHPDVSKLETAGIKSLDYLLESNEVQVRVSLPYKDYGVPLTDNKIKVFHKQGVWFAKSNKETKILTVEGLRPDITGLAKAAIQAFGYLGALVAIELPYQEV